jgi:hypothetical protein
MVYLMLFGALTAAMFAMTSLGVQTAANFSDADRARSIAEAGIRWMEFRFMKMSRPRTTIGNITPTVANSLWPSIRTAIINDLNGMLNPDERPVTFANNTLTTSPIAIDDGPGRFVISITQDPEDARFLVVSSRGTYGDATRTVSMRFRIDKKVKHAIIGKTRIQIGRNTLVEGPITMVTADRYPPVFMLSDFRHLNTHIRDRIDAFRSLLKSNHAGYDNRVNVNNDTERAAFEAAGFVDANSDGFIDEYDIFLQEYDSNGDAAISAAEFTDPSTGLLYDADLFSAIDSLGAPLSDLDVVRDGYQDGIIDNRDAYAKVRGRIAVATTAAAWNANLAGSGQQIIDQIVGPVTGTDPSRAPVEFGITTEDVFDLSPFNFDTSGFRALTGPENGPVAKTGTVFENAVLSASDANGGTVDERTPYGSTSYQATYRRPVFRNMTFRNCRIPKGLNALFDNCTFEGVTFVDLTENITTSSGQTTTSSSAGMTWSKRMKSGSFSKNTVLTSANSWGFVDGNNLRFNDCTFRGPIASSVPTAYTHFTNSFEFTGATLFDNQVDQTATMVCPQTNVEMGSFTDPAEAPSTLVGVVVTGNLDIRGTSVVDGSIIVTGDGAGNTTLGWFGPSDDATEPNSPMPEGGWGKINIRYNPERVMPDGINVSIDILPVVSTYVEGL